MEFFESFEVAPGATEAGEAASAHPGAPPEPAAGSPSDYGGGEEEDGADASGDAGAAAGSPHEAPLPDLWLVFGDAGRSLHDLIYSPVGLEDSMEGTEGQEEGEVTPGEADGGEQQQVSEGPASTVHGLCRTYVPHSSVALGTGWPSSTQLARPHG